MDPRAGPNDVVKRTAALAGNRTLILYVKSHLVIQPGPLFCIIKPCLHMQYVFIIYGRAKLTRIVASFSQRRSGLNTCGDCGE